jgi:hypothetical protein
VSATLRVSRLAIDAPGYAVRRPTARGTSLASFRGRARRVALEGGADCTKRSGALASERGAPDCQAPATRGVVNHGRDRVRRGDNRGARRMRPGSPLKPDAANSYQLSGMRGAAARKRGGPLVDHAWLRVADDPRAFERPPGRVCYPFDPGLSSPPAPRSLLPV